MSSTSARCPLCVEMNSINHNALRCLNPTMNRMHTNRHHVGLSSCVKALSKGLYGSSLIGTSLISRAFPGCFFPNGTGSSARHQSRPDAVLVCSIPGRPAHLGRTNSPTFTLLDLNSALIQSPFPTLKAATAQHASTAIRLKTRSSRNPSRNNKAPICNDYTIKPLINLGLARQKAKGLRGGRYLGARWWRAGKGGSGRPGHHEMSLGVYCWSEGSLSNCLKPVSMPGRLGMRTGPFLPLIFHQRASGMSRAKSVLSATGKHEFLADWNASTLKWEYMIMACDPVNLNQFVVDLRSRHLGYWNQFTAPDPRLNNS
eukprot:1138957-Pelagomonas_calceolata.AAC.1